MNDTRKYLDHLTRETADTVTGKILERKNDGTYLYEDIATGAKRYATANLRDEFAIGSRVRIDRVSASRGTIGSQDTILTRAPREQRGLSETTPAEDRRGTDRVVIQSVTPDPLEIHAGGDPGVQTFVGIGFDSQAAVYVSSYEGGPDPDLTDESAPVVSDTSVVMTISAAIDSARGEFDALINGARARRALRILRPLPRPPLIAIAGNKRSFVAPSDFPRTPTLWLVNATTLELYAELTSGAAHVTGQTVGGLAISGADLILAYTIAGAPFAGALRLMNGTAGSPDTTDTATLAPFTYWDAKMAVADISGTPTLVVASWGTGSTEKGLWLSALNGAGITRFYSQPTAVPLAGLAVGPLSYLVVGSGVVYEEWRDGSGSRASVNLGTANGLVSALFIPDNGAASYYVAVAGNMLFKVALGASATTASISIPTAGTSAPRPWNGVQIGARFYFVLDTSRAIYSINLATFSDMQLLVTLPADVNEYGTVVTYRYIATDGTSLFVTASDRKLRRVDVNTAAVTVGPSYWTSPDAINFWNAETYQLAFIAGA